MQRAIIYNFPGCRQAYLLVPSLPDPSRHPQSVADMRHVHWKLMAAWRPPLRPPQILETRKADANLELGVVGLYAATVRSRSMAGQLGVFARLLKKGDELPGLHDGALGTEGDNDKLCLWMSADNLADFENAVCDRDALCVEVRFVYVLRSDTLVPCVHEVR